MTADCIVVEKVVLSDGQVRAVNGRVAKIISDLLRVQDAINSTLKLKLIVNSAGADTQSSLEAEL